MAVTGLLRVPLFGIGFPNRGIACNAPILLVIGSVEVNPLN